MTIGRENSTLRIGGIDWGSITIFLVLMVLGWLNLYAAVYNESAVEGFDLGQKYGSQLIWIGISLVVATIIMLLDDIYFHLFSYFIYGALLLLLVATLFLGTEVNGARSWIKLGGFSFQPAEFMKFATALALARCMSAYNFSLHSLRSIIAAGLILCIPMCIIVLQNDTGSAMVYSAFLLVLYREGLNGWFYVALGMIVFLFVFSFLVTPTVLLILIILISTGMETAMNGKPIKSLIFLAAVALTSMLIYFPANMISAKGMDYHRALMIASLLNIIPAAIYAYRNKLRNIVICVGMFLGSLLFVGVTDYAFNDLLQVHQQKRVLDLLGVESDLRGWGYNVNQSKIAIGSGGFLGKGFLQGTQTRYDFVPEQSTDFIFCTVGEEWGFVGSTVVLALFGWLIVRLIKMGERQQEPFGRIYCYSVAAIYFFHIMVNVGMTIGLMPVIGIPLPLFSYGGSSLLAFTILFFIAVRLDSARTGYVETHYLE